jgi:DNA polymerase III sliding clamp (beta) subunit (PCNA family)
MGVFFQFKRNEFIAVATDGYRLVKIAKKGINFEGEDAPGVIVPAKTLQIINKSIEDEENINIAINEKHIQFSTENISIVSRLIDEKISKL